MTSLNFQVSVINHTGCIKLNIKKEGCNRKNMSEGKEFFGNTPGWCFRFKEPVIWKVYLGIS